MGRKLVESPDGETSSLAAIALLAEAGRVLGASLDYRTTLQSLTRLVVPSVADLGAVYLLTREADAVECEFVHAVPERQALVGEILARYPMSRLSPHSPIIATTVSGKAQYVAAVDDDMLARLAEDEGHLALLRRLGLRSYCTVPLVARGRVLGALGAGTMGRRRLRTDECSLLEELAGRAAIAVDHARLYELEQEARRAAERASHQVVEVLESIGDVFVAFDAEWRYTYVNARAAAVLKATPEELLGRRVWDAWPGLEQIPEMERLKRVARDRVPEHFEFYYAPLDLWLECRAAPANNEGVTVYAQDVTERKRAEAALRESEERLRLAHAAADLVVWDTDLTTREVVCSPNARTIWGLDRGRLEEFDARIHPEDRPAVDAARREALAGGEFRHDYRVAGPDGAVRWLHSRGEVRRDAAGRPVRFVGVSADVTDRERIREELWASRAQLQIVMDLAPVYIAHCDAERRFVFVNRAYAERLGLAPEDFPGKHIWEMLGREAYESIRPYVETALSGKPVQYEVEVPYERIGRRHMRCAYAPDVDERGQVRGWVSVITDVTDRRRAEEALRRSEERFRLAARASNELIWDWDLLTGEVFWGDNFVELVGQPPEVARPSTAEEVDQAWSWWFDQIHPDDRQRVKDAFEGAVARRAESFTVEYRFRRGDGYAHLVERDYLVYDAEGRPVRLTGSLVDVTERRQAEVRIREMNRELEHRVAERTATLRELNDQLAAFSYSVSHDLRAPLRAIRGFMDALLDDCGSELSATGREYAARITQATQHMNRLCEDLLQLARLSRAEIPLAPTHLGPVVQEALRQLDGVGEPGGELELRLDGAPAVLGHEATLVQVVANLVSNGRKFVAPGTRPRVVVRTEPRGDLVRLWVEDNGIGIDPKHHQRIFEGFERLHRAGEYPGTGVGLAIVRRGVERMNGRVGLTSEVGRGSRFWIELPRAAPPGPDGQP